MATRAASAESQGLRAASKIIADAIKHRAEEMPSKKIPPTVISYVRNGIGYVNVGGPGGKSAPNAWMFETPGARHPLFAPKGSWRYTHGPWYTQPYRPFMEQGAEISAQRAAEKFMDVTIGILARERGFK